jgi:hypothetical protein
VKKRFLFYGINILADQLSVYQTVEDTCTVFPHLADASFAIFDMTPMAAQETFNGFLFLIKYSLKVCNLHMITSLEPY